MSLVNVTQRRQRKSLLGTHRRGRESILPPLSESLFSIHEKTEISLSIFPTEEPAPEEILKHSSPETTHILQRNDLIMNSPDEPVRPPDTNDDTFRNERTMPIKRLDSLFSSPPNDDSFIIHETMLANDDDSVLANTLVDVSPVEATVLTCESPETEYHETVDRLTYVENETNPIEFNSNFEQNTVVDCSTTTCDKTDPEIEKMVNFLDKGMSEKGEFISSCSQQIEEIQRKIDESREEIENMKSIKLYLLTKLRLPVPEEKENNVIMGPPKSMLPMKVASNKFVKESKPEVKPMKPLRQPRASVLLTPRSMSVTVQNQFEDLLK